MFGRIKKLFGYGHTEAIIRGAVKSVEMQEWLLEPANSHYLRAFVRKRENFFAPKVALRFYSEGDREAVLVYLGYVNAVDDECKEALLARKDQELTEKLLQEKLWVPFPYGTTASQVHHQVHAELQAANA